jgi:hypothetical protein
VAFALENVRDRKGEAAILIPNIVCVTHQSAALDEYANGIHRWAVRNQSDQRDPIGVMFSAHTLLH